MRSIAQRELPNKQRLRVCFAGSRSWEHLNELNIPGSPDFTFLANTIYLKPLHREDCHELITSKLEKYSTKYEKNKIDELADQAYSLSGGCPNVINYVGYDFIKNGGKISINEIYRRLITMFSTRWSNLSDSEKKIIILESVEYDDILSAMRLIKKTSNNNYELVGQLWQKFVINKRAELNHQEAASFLSSIVNRIKTIAKSNSQEASHQYIMKSQLEIKTIKEQIDESIESINLECTYRELPHVFNFEDSHDHTYQLNALSKLCSSEEKFTYFISRFYEFIYESTYGPVYDIQDGNRYYCYHNKKKKQFLNKNGARLPSEMWYFTVNRSPSIEKKDHISHKNKEVINPKSHILQHTNTIRGHYQHTRGKKSIHIPLVFNFRESMSILNKGKNPSSKEDYINLQKNILIEFHIFLTNVRQIIENQHSVKYIKINNVVN